MRVHFTRRGKRPCPWLRESAAKMPQKRSFCPWHPMDQGAQIMCNLGYWPLLIIPERCLVFLFSCMHCIVHYRGEEKMSPSVELMEWLSDVQG